MRNRQDENLQQVRVEHTRDNVASGNGPEGEAEPSHPARPTNVERRPKGAFLLCKIGRMRTCSRFESSQRDNVASGNGPEGEAEPSHPARPTSVERRPKGAFLLCKIGRIRTCSRFESSASETTLPAATARRARQSRVILHDPPV